jgi:hypothetical protein
MRRDTALRLYRLLLRAYPPAFRAAYGRELEQLFADVWRSAGVHGFRFWWWLIRDTLAAAPRERISAMRNTMTYVLLLVAAVLGLGIAIVDSSPHWDDTGITVAALLATTGSLGLVHPRGAWMWALAVGIWIPLLESIPSHNPASLLALAFAFVGAYAGAFATRLARRGASDQGPTELGR